MRLAAAVALAMLLAATGCNSEFFSERGTMTSAGSWRNTWRWHPQGCTRDPFDGLPLGKSKSIVTLVWMDAGARDPSLANSNTSPDFPLRLEIESAQDGTPGRVVATLNTRDHVGILLDSSVCTALRLQTQEHPALRPSGRPTLSGELELDCRATDSRIAAHIAFERCEY